MGEDDRKAHDARAARLGLSWVSDEEFTGWTDGDVCVDVAVGADGYWQFGGRHGRAASVDEAFDIVALGGVEPVAEPEAAPARDERKARRLRYQLGRAKAITDGAEAAMRCVADGWPPEMAARVGMTVAECGSAQAFSEAYAPAAQRAPSFEAERLNAIAAGWALGSHPRPRVLDVLAHKIRVKAIRSDRLRVARWMGRQRWRLQPRVPAFAPRGPSDGPGDVDWKARAMLTALRSLLRETNE